MSNIEEVLKQVQFQLGDKPPFDKIYIQSDGNIITERKGLVFNLNINYYNEEKKFNNDEDLAIHLSIYLRDAGELMIPYSVLKDMDKEEILSRIRYVEREDDIRYRKFPEIMPGIRCIYLVDCDGYEGLLTDKLLHLLRQEKGIVITKKELEEIKAKEYQ